MKKLKSIETFEIKGRGKVFTVDMGKHIYPNDSVKLGEGVYIDGHKYKVKGIEQWRLDHPLKGFLVEKIEEDENRKLDSGIEHQ